MQRILLLAALAASTLMSSFAAPAQDAVRTETFIRLHYATFDPLAGEPEVAKVLQSGGADALWIVQFDGRPTEAGREAVRGAGGTIHGYLPDHAYVVRMAAVDAVRVRELAVVRWVGRYHAAYRLEPALVAEHERGEEVPARRYNMVVVDKHNDKPALAAAIAALGGTVDDTHPGSLLFTATLTGAQLLQVARLDQVLWIDRWTPPGVDVDNARIQGGANYVESQGGFAGQGLNAHIYEGIDAAHRAFSGGATNVLSGGESTGHGTNTAGIVFGDGTGNPQFRGLAPAVGKFYTNFSSVTTSRYNVVANLVNVRNVSHTTASWGAAQTTAYTSVSADADDIIFNHDIAWTQSQSNTGNQSSRPEAWAKNIFSIGAVQHFNNSNPNDDSWIAGGASIGPAADGRIKPTLCAYYDSIGTTNAGGGYTTSFGGTSGATPIVAGFNLLAIQMFTTESSPGISLFGHPLRNPGGSRHSNRPHFTTLQALQIASARQYPFNASSTNNRREHQGWGFPDLQRMYDNRAKTFIIDETDVLTQGQVRRWNITVAPGEPELRIVMHYNEPAGNPAATRQLINDLSLSATSPGGTLYRGNNGLTQGNFSVPGGAADVINPIEVIIVPNPPAGVWQVDIAATLIAQDNHLETPQVDADYGLVVSGGTGQSGGHVVLASFTQYGQGCPGSAFTFAHCAQMNPAGGTLAGTTRTEEVVFMVPHLGTSQVLSFDVFTRSTTSATVVVPARIYTTVAGGPAPSPIATTTIPVGPTAGFHTATFAAPVSVTGTFYIGVDSSATDVLVSNLLGGTTGVAYLRPTPLSGPWSVQVLNASWRVTCTSSTQYIVPDLANQGLPVLGTSYDVQLTGALPSSLAVAVTGLSSTVFNGMPLPAPLPNAPGCSILAAPDVTLFTVTSGNGTASAAFAVPNDPLFIAMELFHQWAVLDPANALGIVVSDAGRARVGQ